MHAWPSFLLFPIKSCLKSLMFVPESLLISLESTAIKDVDMGMIII